MRPPHYKQRGVALISVLLVFALITLLATDMLAVNFKDIKKNNNYQQSRQSFHYALGAEQLARQYLHRDYKSNKNIDSLTDSWAQDFDQFNIQQGQMSLRIVDLQGRFNLNNVYDLATKKPDSQQLNFYKRLEQQLTIRPSASGSLLDWIDADNKVSSGGAEDNNYTGKTSPYLSANQLLFDQSELRLVEGIDYPDYIELKQHIATLPGSTKLNLNTAKAEVIKAYAQSLTNADVKLIEQIQQQGGLDSVEDWLARPFGSKLSTAKDYFSVTTEYFEVTIESNYDGRLVKFTSTLYRDAKDGSIQLLKRSIDQ